MNNFNFFIAFLCFTVMQSFSFAQSFVPNQFTDLSGFSCTDPNFLTAFTAELTERSGAATETRKIKQYLLYIDKTGRYLYKFSKDGTSITSKIAKTNSLPVGASLSVVVSEINLLKYEGIDIDKEYIDLDMGSADGWNEVFTTKSNIPKDLGVSGGVGGVASDDVEDSRNKLELYTALAEQLAVFYESKVSEKDLTFCKLSQQLQYIKSQIGNLNLDIEKAGEHCKDAFDKIEQNKDSYPELWASLSKQKESILEKVHQIPVVILKLTELDFYEQTALPIQIKEHDEVVFNISLKEKNGKATTESYPFSIKNK